MLRPFVADLHVHTLLSPCAAIEMTPHNIVLQAAEHGIDIVAITDHNAGDNVVAAQKAARGTGVIILPGMEVETKEEAHILTIFEDMEAFGKWDEIVALSMSGLKNNEQRFGAQFIVDEQDEFVRVKEELLLTPLNLSVEKVVFTVNSLGGLCIASHIDRPAYSIISQLGFIPPQLSLGAVEITRRTNSVEFVQRNQSVQDFPIVCGSDAHYMEEFITGSKTVFTLAEPSLGEVRQAFSRQNGRSWLVKYY